jgi:hypothetical protein
MEFLGFFSKKKIIIKAKEKRNHLKTRTISVINQVDQNGISLSQQYNKE